PSRAAVHAAVDGGAWCLWWSGSGPTVAAMCAFDDADELAERMPADGHTKVLRIDHGGPVTDADGLAWLLHRPGTPTRRPARRRAAVAAYVRPPQEPRRSAISNVHRT